MEKMIVSPSPVCPALVSVTAGGGGLVGNEVMITFVKLESGGSSYQDME